MKLFTILPALAFASWFCTVGNSQAQLTINYDFTSGATVPDGFGQLSEVKTLGGLSGLTTFTNVVTRLDLTTTNVNDPMYLGDLYSSLTFGTSSETQRIAVLLNRAGRDDTDEFGSSLSSLNVTLDESAATNVWDTPSSTGTYQSDGRLSVDPAGAGVAFASGSNSLTALNGAALPSNRVSLLVADFSQGGTATLAGWGVSVTGTAASTGTFTLGANSSISDTGSGATNTVGATLDTTGSAAGGLVVNLAGTTIFAGGVTGSGGLKKTGVGTLVLSGAGSYSGVTDVTAGKLFINGNQSTATGNVTVSSGAVFGGSGTVGGATSIIGTYSAGVAGLDNGVGKQTFSSTLTYGTGSIFEWDLNGNTTSNRGVAGGFDAVDGSGALTVDNTVNTGTIFKVVLGTGVNLADTFWSTPQTWSDIFSSFSGLTGGFDTSNLQVVGQSISGIGSFSVSGTTLTWSAVPEPTSALAGLLLGAGLLRRRRVA